MSKLDLATVQTSQLIFMLSPLISIFIASQIFPFKGSSEHQVYVLFLAAFKMLLFAIPILVSLLTIVTLNKFQHLRGL